MVTRSLLCAVIDSEYKIAQYSQWDGYFEGQGVTTLEFLRSLCLEGEDKIDPGKLEQFKVAVRGCDELGEDRLKTLYKEIGVDVDKTGGWIPSDKSDEFAKKFPHIHRDCGAEIFGHVMDSEVGLSVNTEIEFAADSLFCEYAYVIDLDNGRFEVFEGFNQEPLDDDERFKYLEAETGAKRAESMARLGHAYYPVKRLQFWDLNEPLPDNDTFVKVCIDAMDQGDPDDEEPSYGEQVGNQMGSIMEDLGTDAGVLVGTTGEKRTMTGE